MNETPRGCRGFAVGETNEPMVTVRKSICSLVTWGWPEMLARLGSVAVPSPQNRIYIQHIFGTENVF